LTLGLRFDDQGNPYSRSDSTVFGNFILGTGSTLEERVANGVARPSEHALNRSPKVFHPRVGVAWDVNGKGDWLVRGGFGMYSNWLTPANIQEQFSWEPSRAHPANVLRQFIEPSNLHAGHWQHASVRVHVPGLAGTSLCPTAPCLDAKGGIKGGGRDWWDHPDSCLPRHTSTRNLEHRLGNHLVASVLYSDATQQPGLRRNQIGQVSYGTDINALPGDLLESRRDRRRLG